MAYRPAGFTAGKNNHGEYVRLIYKLDRGQADIHYEPNKPHTVWLVIWLSDSIFLKNRVV